MIITISDDWRLRSDTQQWTVERCHRPVKGLRIGEEQWQPTGHYATIETALEGMYDRRLRESPADTTEWIMREIAALRAECGNVVRRFELNDWP